MSQQVTREELDELYNGQRMTLKQIAQRLGVDITTVGKWMEKLGLPRRTPGETRHKPLDEAEIVRLYIEERQSTCEIAQQMGVDPSTIAQRLDSCGIERRTPGESNRKPLDEIEIERLYLEEHLDTYEIARRMGVAPGTIQARLEERGIKRRGQSELRTIYPRRDFSGDLIEKAYLHGFCIGDVAVKMNGDWPGCTTIHASTGTTKPAQLNLCNELFGSYGHASIRKGADGSYNFQCRLNMSFSFLLEKQDCIPLWIIRESEGLQSATWDPNLYLAFIAGYIDAEGCFLVTKDGKKAHLMLDSCDVGLLQQIHDIFNNRLEIICPPVHLVKPKGTPTQNKRQSDKVYYTNKDCWRMGVYRKVSVLRLCELFEPYLRHADRRADMFAVWANVITRGV